MNSKLPQRKGLQCYLRNLQLKAITIQGKKKDRKKKRKGTWKWNKTRTC